MEHAQIVHGSKYQTHPGKSVYNVFAILIKELTQMALAKIVHNSR